MSYPEGINRQALAENLGAALRLARKAQGWTQEQAAERLEISSEFLARVERGKGFPSIQTLARMVKVLGVSADALFGLPGERVGEIAQQTKRRDSAQVKRLISRLRGQSALTLRFVKSLVATLDEGP